MSSNCTIKESVKNFREDFKKKIVGNSRTVKISNNGTLVTITPSASSNSVQSRDKAYRMAERQIKELDKLSKQYLGLKGSFRPGKIEVSPEGVVSYTVRPPFNMYRELLRKQEGIEDAKSREIQEAEARIQDLEKTKAEVSSVFPDGSLKDFVVENLDEGIKKEVNLFNYSEEVINEVGQNAFFNDQSFPEDLWGAHEDMQNAETNSYEELFNGKNAELDEQTKLQSISAYAGHLIRSKEKLIENLNNKKKVLVEDANATEEFIPDHVRKKYLESVNTIDKLIDRSRQDIRTLKTKQEEKMIGILKDELSDIYKDLQGGMETIYPAELLATFTDKDIYSRIQLLEKFLPTGISQLSPYSTNAQDKFFETEEYGDFKGALSLAFTGNPAVAVDLKAKLEIIQSLLNKRMDDILLEMVKENPIFLSKMSDVRGDGLKMSIDDFKKIINTELRDLYPFEASLTSIMENDSQMEEFLARAEVAFETKIEHNINKNFAKRAMASYEKAVEAVESGVGHTVPKGQTAREYISRKMYDKNSFGQKMVDKFTGTYGKLLNEIKTKTKAIRYASGFEAEELYKEKIQIIALQHDLIKPHMLKSIKERVENNPNMSSKLEYFNGISDQEMEEYEAALKEKLGKDFDRQIEKIYTSLVNWEFTEDAALSAIMPGSFKRVYEDSPWDFAKNFERLNEEISLGITSNLYTKYQDEEGNEQKVLNNPALKNIFLVPKGNPQSNPIHFSQQFEQEIESDQAIYDSWKDLNAYNQYSSPRVGQGYNTITRARKDAIEVLDTITKIKDIFTKGMHRETLRELFKFLADYLILERFSGSGIHYQNSKGITTHFSNESIQDINLRTKSLMVKYPYEQLRLKLIEEGVTPHISAEAYHKSKKNEAGYKVVRTGEDTDETFAQKELNRDAKIAREYHKIMAKSLASQEIHAAFNTDILENSLAQGNMAALQRGAEKSLASVKVLQSFMAERNKRQADVQQGNTTISKRPRAEKRFNSWIETDIKNNRKGLNRTVVRNPDTGDFELDAELAKDTGNRGITVENKNWMNAPLVAGERRFENLDGSTTRGRMMLNFWRRFKYYEDAQRDYLNVINAILKGELDSADFAFTVLEDISSIVRSVSYHTDYDEKGQKFYVKKYKVKVLGEDGTEKTTTEVEKISKGDYTSALGLHFSSAAARMGRELNAAGIFGSMGKAFSFSSLAFSAVVGTKNRLEGKVSATLEAERQEDASTLRDANNFMSGYNKYRILGQTKYKALSTFERAQFKTLDMFVESLDVFQDKKDFIHKMTNQRNTVLTNAFGFGIDLPERKNQISLLVKNASQMLVKDKDGKQVPIFEDGEFKIYIPGTLTLKPEFREGPEGKRNIEIWENFGANTRVRGQANPALDLSLKTTADIINSQGNFSDQDSLPAFEHPLGSLLLLFNRWFGSRANRMFITKKYLNPITGIEGGEAYLSLKRMTGDGKSPQLIAGYGALLALQVATPGVAGGLVLGSVLTGFMHNMIQNKRRGGSLAPTREHVLQTAGLFSEVAARFITFPFQYFGNSKKLNVIDSDWYKKHSPLEKLLQEDKISPKEAGRIKLAGASLATSLGISLSFLGMRMLLASPVVDEIIEKITAVDDDDDEEEAANKRTAENILKMIQNTLGYGMENIGNNLQGSAFGELNILPFITDKMGLPLLGSLEKVQKNIESFGDDGYSDNDAGALTATFATLNALGIVVLPGQIGNMINFYKTEGKEGKIGFMQNKVYKPTSWTNKFFIESEMTSEDVIRNLFNKNGFGLRNKLKKEFINATAEQEGIFFHSFSNKYDQIESGIDSDKGYLSKVKTETYLEMAKRVHEVLVDDTTIKERSPEYIKDLEEAIEYAEEKLKVEETYFKNDYDSDKKYKNTDSQTAEVVNLLQKYEDEVESKYKN